MNSSADKNIDQLIFALQNVLKQFPQIKLAVLFGSMATGENHPASDLDLAITAIHPLTITEKIAIIGALAEKTGRSIDLIDLKITGEPLLGQIIKHGRKIFGDNTEYAQLISRHLFDQAILCPIILGFWLKGEKGG
jgi:predicted nucleotidyltransferase